jgi:Predicted phosphatases
MKAVIFDFDGTIGETMPIILEAFRGAIEPFTGKHISDEDIIAAFGPSEEGIIKAFLPDAYEQGITSYYRIYKELHYICPKPYDGIKNILKYLKDHNIITALVTGKGKISCQISLSLFGLEESFDLIETGSVEGQCKEEGIQKVIQRFHLDPQETYYVGDAASDIDCARRAGVAILSAAWSDYADIQELEKKKPDRMFSTTSEFIQYLEKCV